MVKTAPCREEDDAVLRHGEVRRVVRRAVRRGDGPARAGCRHARRRRSGASSVASQAATRVGEHGVAFAVRRDKTPFVALARLRPLGEALADLGQRQSFPVAVGDLLQRRIGVERRVGLPGGGEHDPHRLHGAAERRGDEPPVAARQDAGDGAAVALRLAAADGRSAERPAGPASAARGSSRSRRGG